MADNLGFTGSLTWLGQAGFLIEGGALRVLIDPYLSDSLYEKYKNTKFPHRRMNPSPFTPEEMTDIDFVLCTHGHSDHLDPGTLPGIALASPACRFIVPSAEKQKALERGVPEERFQGLTAGETFDDSLNRAIRITAVASAHEELSVDSKGRNLYLGYVIDIDGYRLYHSGDCVPYDGLAEKLKELEIDAALLPVNGRDELRSSNGVPGNFTVEEAAELCAAADIAVIIPHHFGMFDFNTEDPDRIKSILSESGLIYSIPVIGKALKIPFKL